MIRHTPVLFLGVVTVAFVAWVTVSGTADALDAPVSGLRDWESTCVTVDGGVAGGTDAAPAAAGDMRYSAAGAYQGAQESLYIANDSSTCVRIGGRGVPSTRGFRIGDGCRDGSGVSVDARNAYCQSEGAAITVDVVGGRR